MPTEPATAGTLNDLMPEVQEMAQASWAAVVGAGKSTVKAVALLHRMEPSYRATARLDSGFYDRIASLANDAKEFTTAVAAPGRKAKIAWERALQKVPPGCLVRLEGTEGKDSDRISLLRYDGKSKEAKIAIWFEKIEAVLTDFPLLQRAVEKMGTGSAARDAIQAMANSLLIQVYHLNRDRKTKNQDHEGGSDDQEGNSSPPLPSTHPGES